MFTPTAVGKADRCLPVPPYTPGILYECEKKGVAKFAFRK